jgi:predicted glycogen debranching enzyme
MLDFGREVASHEANSLDREWLVTNGIGGFAAGTVANVLTRRYHGLLVAALQPPLGRTVLLTRLDETATYDSHPYPLFSNQWGSPNSPVEPPGFLRQERFHLEGTTPVWTYACADARLEKRIWMQPDANTTYIRYELCRATLPLHLTLKAIVNYRDFHSTTTATDWKMQIESVPAGVKVVAFDGATAFYLLSDRAAAIPRHEWYRNYFLMQEYARGLDYLCDNLYAVEFQVTLNPGEAVTIVASLGATPDLNGAMTYAERRAYEHQLILQSELNNAPDWIQHLVLAADQFIVRRVVGDQQDGCSVIAGYHWFGDWGRDTMISLPGLTLATRRYDIAARILRTFARFVDQGMLPNRFPDGGEIPEYNTVDATLWYFEAIRAYHAATGDDDLLRDLYPVIQDIIDWHQRGTRYQIHVDPQDSLLFAGESGVQLTWMDAKVGDWVVTPRTGKAVEINALWYNALMAIADFARRLGLSADAYQTAAVRVHTSFARFWNGMAGYCYDVIDGPAGNDATLRPNQLLAVSLEYSPLEYAQQRAVVDSCARYLLASIGLHSLEPAHPAYIGRYSGGPLERDSAYHQGAVWAWLIGPFVSAHWRVYKNRDAALDFLKPFQHHLAHDCIGSICEIAEGNLPYAPRGAVAQAWSVAEVLRVWRQVSGQ